jgi:hypothetical protein
MAEREKLELGETVGGAYRGLIENLGTLFVFLVAWYAVGAIAMFAMLALEPTSRQVLSAFGTDAGEAMDMAIEFVNLVPLALVSIAASISIVVAWHRLIVLRQPVASPFPVGLLDILRYGWRVVVVFSPMMLVGAVAAGAFYGVLPAAEAERKALAPFVGLIAFIGIFTAILLLGRLFVALPATAVGDRTMTLWHTWQVTKGNSWRIFWGSVFCTMPFSAVGKILENVILGTEDGSGQFLAVWLLSIAVELMGYVVLAGFFSYAYLHFTQDDGEDRAPASHFS